MTACVLISSDDTRVEVTGLGYDPTQGHCQTADGERVIGHSHPSISRIIEIGCVCNNAQVANGTVIGQPTEGALAVLAIKTGLAGARSYFRRLNEMPFSSETKWMAVHVEPANRVT
jgi:Ca2+-transporting ATPase